MILFENNQSYDPKLFLNVQKCYPKYWKESQFNLIDYCMNDLHYSKVIHRFEGGLDDLLIP